MKILHYINNIGSGGAERLLSFMLPLLKEMGHDVHLAYCNNDKNIESFEKQILDANVIVHNFNISRFSPVNIIKLRQLIRQEQFDVIHAHLFPTQYWLALSKPNLTKNIKYIKTEHNTSNGRRKFSAIQPIDKFIYRQYDHLIGITDEVTKALDNWTNMGSQTSIIENGVALDHVRNALKDYNASAYDFLNPHKKNLLMVASFSGEAKDQISLIRSLSYLPENFNLYLAGEGELMPLAKKIVKECKLGNRVHFLGMRPDVYILMNLVDINILSTNYEGLSGVALESMASAKPFIGANVPGVKDIVPNQDFLFPPKSPLDLAKKIEKVITNDQFRKSLILQGNAHVEEYDIRKMAKRHEDLYKSLLLA